MTAVTVTTIIKRPLAGELISGTVKRLADYYIDCTSAGTDGTLIMTSYDANIEGIVSIEEMLAGAQNGGTANTWSSATITFAGHAGSGVWKLRVLCTIT